MDGLTIREAAQTTGWSPRMLRYLESVGLIQPLRSGARYRIYGAAELQRLRTLRELLGKHGLGLSDVAFAKRLREEPALAETVTTWIESKPRRPETVSSSDWLRFEQEKHQKLLSVA
jgi:MerR family copper efflux transcriptional regulator